MIDFVPGAALSLELAQADFRVHLAAWGALHPEVNLEVREH